MIAAGRHIDGLRRSYAEELAESVNATAGELLGLAVGIHYRRGWPEGQDLQEALDASWERDSANNQTHVGPHRAELSLEVNGQAARHRLSRGQQKLLGIGLVLAQSRIVSKALNRNITLLIDEPAAELDSERLDLLMDALKTSGAQLFIPAITA